jgi:hypothetical protein
MATAGNRAGKTSLKSASTMRSDTAMNKCPTVSNKVKPWMRCAQHRAWFTSVHAPKASSAHHKQEKKYGSHALKLAR